MDNIKDNQLIFVNENNEEVIELFFENNEIKVTTDNNGKYE